MTDVMSKDEIQKMQVCAGLLTPPGPEVVCRLIDALNKIMAERDEAQRRCAALDRDNAEFRDVLERRGVVMRRCDDCSEWIEWGAGAPCPVCREVKRADAAECKLLKFSEYRPFQDQFDDTKKQLDTALDEIVELEGELNDVNRILKERDLETEQLRADAARLSNALTREYAVRQKRMLEEKENEINRLNAAKTIVLGRCRVIVCPARDATGVMNEVVLIDAEDRKICLGERCDDFVGQYVANDDPRLLARLVVSHPDGGSILAACLEDVLVAVIAEAARSRSLANAAGTTTPEGGCCGKKA